MIKVRIEKERREKMIKISSILNDTKPETVESKSKEMGDFNARCMVFHIMRNDYGMSYQSISEDFGFNSHTTSYNALITFEQNLKINFKGLRDKFELFKILINHDA